MEGFYVSFLVGFEGRSKAGAVTGAGRGGDLLWTACFE